MFEKIIRFSVQQKLVVALMVLAIILLGIRAMFVIPLDAVPDITNNQVQVVTSTPTLAAQEVEQFITYPVEMAFANIPNVEEIRSISRFGLSVVTVVFEEDVPILQARQYVSEQLQTLGDAVPAHFGTPEMMPITTGLGEIYQYTLNVLPGFEDDFDIMELRTIQDWIVKRQLTGTPGIVEVSSFGGYVKEFEVSINPTRLNQLGITIPDVFDALEKNNRNSGGGYIERNGRSLYIRTEGVVHDFNDVSSIIIERRNGIPILIKDVAEVKAGHGIRFGALTKDGKGEAVGGITLMIKGGSSSEAIEAVHQRIEQIKNSLPAGVTIEPFLDRSQLVGKTIKTVSKNLIEGGAIVIIVLLILIGNFRASFIVASIIPLSLLFAFILMEFFGVSANLMSLGAIDFGIVVDGAVIITEAIIHAILLRHTTAKSAVEFDRFIIKTSSDIYKTAAFGVIIILVVFIPIMSLTGIEGKMFRPLAQTFSFAILGAFILTLTYVPMMSSLFLKNAKVSATGFTERLMGVLQRSFQPVLVYAIKHPKAIVYGCSLIIIVSIFIFTRLGAVFIPTLEEGDLAMQMTLESGSSLTESIKKSTEAESLLLKNFPEVKHVVSKIGTAEVPTDPMGIEDADIMIILKDKDDWVTTFDREVLIDSMKRVLDRIENASFEFSQPIQLRFNELITGSKTDVAVKIFGENTDTLRVLAEKSAEVIKQLRGAADVKVEQTDGLTQLLIKIDRQKCAQYGVNVDLLNQIVRTAYAGEKTGTIYEGERRFDLVVRLTEETRENFNLNRIYVHNDRMEHIPVSELVAVQEITGPVQIQREDTKRRITIGINVRDRDVETLIKEIDERLSINVGLPPGYYFSYGGAFENLQSAKKRLLVAVPAALLMILFLLYLAFGSLKNSFLIFSAVPLSAVGGVLLLWIRGLPFSISAGVGFIALFGVAVLNGIVLIGYFQKLINEHPDWTIEKVVENGTLVRLRPVIMTALVALLGFLPMAISNSEGAEVQRPLATVVIGGLITSTLLTLLVLPAIYTLTYRKTMRMNRLRFFKRSITTSAILIFSISAFKAQSLRLEVLQNAAINKDSTIVEERFKLQMLEAKLATSTGLGNTNLNLQYGQINSSIKGDYNISVQQELDNPITTIERRKAIEMQINVQKQIIRLKENEVRKVVALNWYQWLAEREKLTLFNSMSKEIDAYAQVLERSINLGSVSKLEAGLIWEMIAMHLAAERKQFNYVLEAKRQLELIIQQPLILEPELTISTTTIETFPFETELASDFYELNTLSKTASDASLKATRASFLPPISIGYFNQQIDGVSGLDGLVAGVAIPIFQADQRLQNRVAQISRDRLIETNQRRIQSLKTDHEMVLAYADFAMNQWNSHGEKLANQSKLIDNAALESLNAGEINSYEFIRLKMSALNLNLERISLKLDVITATESLKYFTLN